MLTSVQLRPLLMASFLSLLIVASSSAQTTSPAPGSLKATLLTFGKVLGTEQGMSALASLTSLEVSTAPLGTSTGGFTFTFDPQLRTWTRSASSFGPSFAERSLTTGRAKVSAGFNVLHASYDSFGGFDLTNGDLHPARNVRSTATPIATTSLKVNLSSDTVVGFAHVGVTDNFDVGIAIPWVRVSLDAEGIFFNAAGADLSPGQHPVIPSTTSSGVGDIAIFGKYQLWRQGTGGLAAAVEARLPSGDKDELRGLGVTRTLASLIWSKGGKVSPHANAGFEFWSDSVAIASDGSVFAKNQAKYAVGVEIEAHPRATVVVDLVGRRLLHGGQIGYQTVPATVGTGSADLLIGIPEGVNMIALAPGVKLNVWRSILVTGNVLASLTNEGVRARFIPVFGIDVAF
jgi:hypothetical protein